MILRTSDCPTDLRAKYAQLCAEKAGSLQPSFFLPLSTEPALKKASIAGIVCTPLACFAAYAALNVLSEHDVDWKGVLLSVFLALLALAALTWTIAVFMALRQAGRGKGTTFSLVTPKVIIQQDLFWVKAFPMSECKDFKKVQTYTQGQDAGCVLYQFMFGASRIDLKLWSTTDCASLDAILERSREGCEGDLGQDLVPSSGNAQATPIDFIRNPFSEFWMVVMALACALVLLGIVASDIAKRYF